jgi:hypothetical protein
MMIEKMILMDYVQVEMVMEEDHYEDPRKNVWQLWYLYYEFDHSEKLYVVEDHQQVQY